MQTYKILFVLSFNTFLFGNMQTYKILVVLSFNMFPFSGMIMIDNNKHLL